MNVQRSCGRQAVALTGALAPRSPRRTHLLTLGALTAFLAFAVSLLAGSQMAGAVGSTSTITIKAFEYDKETGTLDHSKPLADFEFNVSLENSPNSDNADPLLRPGRAPIPSHSPLMAIGDQDSATVTLPDNEAGQKYLISIRSPDHKMWGQYVSLPNDQGEVDIGLRPTPLKLGKLVVHVFNDNLWTNGAPDTGEAALAGFHVTLEDQIDGQVSVDYFNNPLCGGDCVTDANGNVTIPDLGPATYFIYVTPPGCAPPDPSTGNITTCTDSEWTQTTTIDGGFPLVAQVAEADDGLGAPGETIWEGPTATTGWWFGFVHKSLPIAGAGNGTITGTARNWVEWPPYTVTTFGEPLSDPFVALSDSGTDATIYVGRGDSDGNFVINGVPAGTYNLSIWDEQLSYIMRFVSVTVGANQEVDLNDVGVSRWFGWLSGYVYLDTGKAYDGTVLPAGSANNGIRDCADPNDWTTCEPGLENFPMDQRWRDGSMKEDTLTKSLGDPHGPGYYEYPTAEGGPLGKFFIGEVGFTRYGTEPGASVHNEIDPSQVTHVCASPPGASPDNCDSSEGGGLLTNQLIAEGHRAQVDWGKRDYLDAKTTTLTAPVAAADTTISIASAAGLPRNDRWKLTIDGETLLVTGGSGTTTLTVVRGYGDTLPADHVTGATVKYGGEAGQIVGITYFATTRNEFYGDTATNESYEAAIPDVEVRLEGPGPDGVPNTADDVVLNDYVTDHWQHPSSGTDGQTCDLTDSTGNDISSLVNPAAGTDCIEVPLTGQETKDGAFDGGYAFATYCPASVGGLDVAHFHDTGESVCADGSDPIQLAPGTYITHMLMPKSADPTDSRPCNPSGDSSSSASQPKMISGPFGNEAGADTACLFRPEQEEDVNVDLGAQYEPAIPPPPCTGDDHLINQDTLTSRSPFFGVAGAHAPLCDKKLVVLKPKQNANADFFLMTNQKNGLDVEEPGRVVGGVFDDIYFDRDPHSLWYGEPRPLADIPIGIYDYGYGDATDKHPRLLTTLFTDENGHYEAVLPSTETFNCPIPQGPCPGMYIAVIDDPGTAAHPNAGYNPNYLTATTAFEIWPGQTDQLDTPIDPVSGTGCELPTLTPELLQVNRLNGAPSGTPPAGYDAADGPYVRAAGSNDTWTLARTAVQWTGGAFRLTVNGNQTGNLAWNSTAAQVQSALVGLASVGAGNVTVTGGPLPGATPAAGQLTITFGGTLTGSARTVTVASAPAPNALQPATAGFSLVHTVTGSAGTGVPAGYIDNTPALRRFVIQGANFGTTPGSITLSDQNGRLLQVDRTFNGIAASPTLASGGIISWQDRQIVFQVPAPAATFLPGPWQLMITTAGTGGLTTPNGLTIHVLGTVGTVQYNPHVKQVAKPTIGGHELQEAINRSDANDLLILGAGVYEENVIMPKPLKLQGLGVGGSVGFVEAGGPPSEDPRVNIQGSVIVGKFFRDNEVYWNSQLPATWAGQTDYVSKGADITVLAPSTTAYGTGIGAARIDGIAVELGQGSFGAGGLEVHAYAQNLQVTNDVFESDKGSIGGAINLGTPYHGSQHNENVRIRYDRIMGSGGLTRGGGITIFNGADNYEIANSTLCSNFSVEYGAGISHWGKSNGGSIHNDQIYYNDAVDSGAGISIYEEIPQPIDSIPWNDPRRGSGSVDIRNNIIEANYSGDDGGGVFVANSLGASVNIVNNMIVNNGAADLGGAVMLDDASNVSLINNTVAQNAVTGSSETSDGLTHGAGLTSEANDPGFQATLAAGAPDYSNPVALFNNIFWNNEACTLDQNQTPPALVGCSGELLDPNATYIDFEVHGTTNNADTFTNARYNLFTNGTVLESDRSTSQLPGATTAPVLGFPTNPATNGNTIGVDPLFVDPFATAFAVGPSRTDPSIAAVTITTADPPVGIAGNYHLQTALISNQISGAVDRGVRCSNTPVPPPLNPIAACTGGGISAPIALNADIDGQLRPQLRTLRARTPWDRGADEVPTTAPLQ